MVDVTIPVTDPPGDANDDMDYFAGEVQTALNNLNNAAVFTTGNQTIAGDKTFDKVLLDANFHLELNAGDSDNPRITFASGDYVRYVRSSNVRQDVIGSAAITEHHATKFVSNFPVVLKSYTVATVPTASSFTGSIIYVSDETGGAVVAQSNGSVWQRLTDLATIS